MKTRILSADNFKKILDLDGLTPEPAIRSGDTGQRIPCFDSCQLITTLMCNISLAVLPNWLESMRLNIGFPVVRTDGLAVYGEVITKFSGMVRFTCPWCSEGALRSPEFRYEELHGIFHDDDNIKLQAVLSSRKGLVKRGK